MLPVVEKFMAAHRLPDVTVVADAGMISDANMKAIEAAGLSFILGMKVPDVPYVIDAWRRGPPSEAARKECNGAQEEKPRPMAGIKGYKTTPAATPDGEPVTADFVISSYHE